MRLLFTITLLLISQYLPLRAQCCSAGGSCPIACGGTIGVLPHNLLELNANLQYVSTNKFLKGSDIDKNFLDSYKSSYGYFRCGYGLSSDLTVSLESGYHFNRTQIGVNAGDTISIKGWGDLIALVKYNLIAPEESNSFIECTVGAGVKLPLGNPESFHPYRGVTLDSLLNLRDTTYYYLNPPAIRTTTGSEDAIATLSVMKSFPDIELRVFTTMMYIYKGWNKLGERSGDYASVGWFVTKSFFEKLGVTLQLKSEWIGTMHVNDYLEEHGYYNFDPKATGSKKLLFVPQLSYSTDNFTFYAMSEIPLYQYVNKQQIASQYFFTAGLSYQIMMRDSE